MNWLVCVPVWGEPYTETFLRVGLPALQQAAKPFYGTIRLLIYSDQPERILAAAPPLKCEARTLPSSGGPFDMLSDCHRDSLAMAHSGERVCLLTADLVVSSNLFTYGESILRRGATKIIMIGSIRALLDFRQLPSTFASRGLLEWAWRHQHPMTTESIFPNGCNQDVSRMFFVSGPTVISRQVLPHPLVVVRDERQLSFTPTIDSNLAQSFYEHEAFVCTDPTEIALVELSVADKAFHRVNSIQARLDHEQVVIVNPMQRFLIGHRIGIVGNAVDCGDAGIVARIESYSKDRYPLYRG